VGIGGHASIVRWWIGAEGERETGKQIELLGADWHREHDLEHEHGNWDHVTPHFVAASGVGSLRS
jgi:hypothetical protein